MSEWTAKRFWKEAVAVDAGDGFTVHLDGRPVKTPAKAALILPNQALAGAVAEEWNAQQERIDPYSMPVTRAANAAIDKVAPNVPAVAKLLVEYGETDLLCYRAEAPEALVARQAAAWDPLLDWAATALKAPLNVTSGVVPCRQPAESLASLSARVSAHSPFALTGLHDLVTLSGSLVIGLAAVAGWAGADDLWERSRIDETWQQEQWGRDDEAAAMADAKRRDFLQALRFFNLTQASA
ncbi:MAG: ATP12 family protein [Paracoccaceae bacterium]